MLAVVGTWVKSLVVIVLLGNLAEFLLPKGDLRRYTGLVVGLILLLVMVSPVWRFIQGAHVTVIQQELLGSGTGKNLSAVIQREEWNQAEAMVLSFPGVSSCQIRRLPKGEVVVRVDTTKPINTSQLTSYVKAAVQMTTGASTVAEVQVHYHGTVTSEATGTKRRE
jgi:stage III sporulation protein AF